MKERFIDKLLKWIRSKNLNEYSDEYNNWCFGNKNQKHIVHLHPYNNHVDIEINNTEKFNKLLTKFKNKIRPHEWHPDKWLVVNVIDENSYNIAKEIICQIIDKK